jgi:hypothetical protein
MAPAGSKHGLRIDLVHRYGGGNATRALTETPL